MFPVSVRAVDIIKMETEYVTSWISQSHITLQETTRPFLTVHYCFWVTQLLYNYHSRQLFHFVVLCLWMIKAWELSQVQSQGTAEWKLSPHISQYSHIDSENFRVSSSAKNWSQICVEVLTAIVSCCIFGKGGSNVSKEHNVPIFSVEAYKKLNCVALVRERIIQTERLQLTGEVSANCLLIDVK
jgi:hypothetical protein